MQKQKQLWHSRKHPADTHLLTGKDSEDSEAGSEAGEYSLYSLTGGNSKEPLLVKAKVKKKELIMEVDTGVTMSIISSSTYHSLGPSNKIPPLKATTCKLKTYTGEQIKVQGKLKAMVTVKKQTKTLQLLVVEGDGPNLMG